MSFRFHLEGTQQIVGADPGKLTPLQGGLCSYHHQNSWDKLSFEATG